MLITRALVWRAYKVRLRSPFTSTLDFVGPIVIIMLYLCVKLLLNSIAKIGFKMEEEIARAKIFRNPTSKPLDARTDLPNFVCPKIPYYSETAASSIASRVSSECGIELVTTTSKQNLIDKLSKSLADRIAFGRQIDLNRPNSTVTKCPTLDGSTEPIYQIGIVYVADKQSFDIFTTDAAVGSKVIHQPYSQGSNYHESVFPHSDLNTGLYLLEICLTNALETPPISPQPPDKPNNNSKILNHRMTRNENQRQSYSNEEDTNNITTRFRANLNQIQWRTSPFPTVAASQNVPGISLVFLLSAFFCNSLSTVMRIADDNESRLHHYIRISGISAVSYWMSQFVINCIHMIVQSLIMAVLLAIPTSDILLDPFYESNITIRWLILFSYSISISAHAIFIGSIFERTTHAILVTCLLGVAYSVFPITFMIQWNPYGFSSLGLTQHLILLSPVSNFEALVCVMTAICLQTDGPLNWSHLGAKIIGGGISDWSFGGLWLLLIIQALFWLVATILMDQMYYCTSLSPVSFAVSLLDELCCCNALLAPEGANLIAKTRTRSRSSGSRGMKSAPSKPDPNRICCSIRHISVFGSTIFSAHTKGDILKLAKEQRGEKTPNNPDPHQQQVQTKSHQYLINRRDPVQPYRASEKNKDRSEPIMIDEAILQHIVWRKTRLAYDDLSLDFRFNQVSYILGQTDLKDLLFATLLGLRTLHSGYIELDGTRYQAGTLGLARPKIGYLGERDIFLNEMSIFENLQFFGSLRDPAYGEYDSESHFVLSLLHLLRRKADLPGILTRRSARKLALAAAAVGHTKLLLLVEPTMNLRWGPRNQVLNLLKKYKSIRSIVVDTSDIDEAVAFGDRIALLKNGKVDLDGSPRNLARKLTCGYWLVFEPTASQGQAIDSESIRALEKLTSELFKQDKMQQLDATKRSIYQELLGGNSKSNDQQQDESKVVVGEGEQRTKTDIVSNGGEADHDKQLQKMVVLLKIQQTDHSKTALCSILKMFANHNIHGFRLAELTYESLEDVIVLRMSKAIYPDLPPDLLLSLQHRTRINPSEGPRSPQVSVRRFSGDHSQALRPIFGQHCLAIIRERAGKSSELLAILGAIIFSILAVCFSIWSVQSSFSQTHATVVDVMDAKPNSYSGVYSSSAMASHLWEDINQPPIGQLYRRRIGFFVLDRSLNQTQRSSQTNRYLDGWNGSRKFAGSMSFALKISDSAFIANQIQASKDMLAAIIFYDPDSNGATILYEPRLPHAMLAGMRAFIDHHLSFRGDGKNLTNRQYKQANYLNGSQISPRDAERNQRSAKLANQSELSHSRHLEIDERDAITGRRALNRNPIAIDQDWHQMIRGYLNRRFYYGLGFAVAEGVSMGIFIISPVRHRYETRSSNNRVNTTYWFAMGLFDVTLSLVLVAGYTLAIIFLEQIYSVSLTVCILLVLVIYKLAALPLTYLVSLVVDSRANGFAFIFVLYCIINWLSTIHLRSFLEWTLLHDDYQYIIATWMMLSIPISALVESLTNISQMGQIDNLCKQVPAYLTTEGSLSYDGVFQKNLVNRLMDKVRECLANGKTGVSTDVLHINDFGIIWPIALMLISGLISWIFLIFSERVFGIFARRLSSIRISNDPLKTIVRTSDSSTNVFRWDRERDRLVSEYIRCLNEPKYARLMARNCLYVRIWLKPLGDQSYLDKHLSTLLNPMTSLGQPRNDIQVELKTTLQLFIRLGNEFNPHRVDKIQLIEAYTKFHSDHSGLILNFAVVDWTRENLYKILLHGHYNTKSSALIT